MISQENIGKFIADKRKEHHLTQEQFAEKLGVSNRSISRWEKGRTMPDYSLLPEICKILEVTITELLEGEELEKEPIHMFIGLLDYEKQKKQKVINQYMIVASICFGLLLLNYHGAVLGNIHKVGLLQGILGAVGVVCLCGIFYYNNKKQKYTENEIKAFLGINAHIKMRTAGEMLQYARRNQKAELKQYEKGFQAISEKLLPEEAVLFSMVAESFIQNEDWSDCWKPWHVALGITDKRILVSGESIRGRFMTHYDVESYNLTDVVSVNYENGKIIIDLIKGKLTIDGKQLEVIWETLKERLLK